MSSIKVVSGDFNGDGRTDLAMTGNSTWNTIPVAFSNGDGTFNVTNLGNAWWASNAALSNVKFVTGDFNADGRSDTAMMGNGTWNTLPVAFSNGNGAFNVTNLSNPTWATNAAVSGAKVVDQY